MWRLWVASLIQGLVGLFAIVPHVAQAACTVPNQLTNGQTADASQVMANFNAVTDCVNTVPSGSINALQYNAGSGALGAVTPLTNGQIAIGSTGNAPQAAQLSAGTGITITSGPGSITISNATSPYTMPKLANFTIGNQPTGATATDTSTGLAMVIPSSTPSPEVLWSNAPYPTSFPATFIVGVNASTDTTGGHVGIVVGDGTGKFIEAALNYFSGSWHLQVNNFINYNNITSTYFAESIPNRFDFLSIEDDGLNFNFYAGNDRNSMLQFVQVPKNSFIGTPTQVGLIALSNGAGAGLGGAYFDYEAVVGAP